MEGCFSVLVIQLYAGSHPLSCKYNQPLATSLSITQGVAHPSVPPTASLSADATVLQHHSQMGRGARWTSYHAFLFLISKFDGGGGFIIY